jgi:hypothetical protein
MTANMIVSTECHYAESRIFIVMLNVIMLSVVMLSVIMLGVVAPSPAYILFCLSVNAE